MGLLQFLPECVEDSKEVSAMIPKSYKEALKRVTKGRPSYSPASSKMTREVNDVIEMLKSEHPHLFREQKDGSVLPRIPCGYPDGWNRG